MTLVEEVFFLQKSSTPTARETFLSFPSHIFLPSLMSLLRLSVFRSGELVPFVSPFCSPQPSVSALSSAFCLLLLPFTLFELSAQERSIPAHASLSRVLLFAFLLLLHISFIFLLPQASPPPHSHWSAADGGGCMLLLMELATPF